MHYDPPPDAVDPGPCLVRRGDGGPDRRFPFGRTIEIGRFSPGDTVPTGTLAIADPTVSRRHCVITRDADGRCFVRDLSRNGTWLDERRLVPNVEIEIRSGQAIRLGDGHAFFLEGPGAGNPDGAHGQDGTRTFSLADARLVTVLVGDVRDYAALVRKAPPGSVQRCVMKVFRALEGVVEAHGGSVKEYQGDALFAFWEHAPRGSGAIAACRAALALRAAAERLAEDPAAWELREFPLRVDWAVATGVASMHNFGRHRPTGLSMVGEPVVLAFRLEKMATDETGPIVVCRATRDMAVGAFVFEDLGTLSAKGFDDAVEAFALRGDATERAPG